MQICNSTLFLVQNGHIKNTNISYIYVPDLCPPELPVLRKGYCYGLFDGIWSGIEAQRQCRSYKADLVWILDREEQTFIDRTFAKR